jgi:murein L,D-transpeptidase YcbB/YkuD
MKKLLLSLIIIGFGFSFLILSCEQKNPKRSEPKVAKVNNSPTFDSTLVRPFFKKYPELQEYQKEVTQLYLKRNYQYTWYDKKGILEVGHLLYNKINHLEEEGVETTIPYKKKLDAIFQNSEAISKPNATDELFMSSFYFLYVNKVLKGLDTKKTIELGWFLPRKKLSYINYLDSIMANPSLIEKNEKEVFGQYYSLKEVLQKYKKIAKDNSWDPIVTDSSFIAFKPGDSSQTISQIRHRLFVLGDLESDSESATYDDSLITGILKYKNRTGSLKNNHITKKTITSLNTPIVERIKTIMVNMERCRWITADIAASKELIVVNIPSYELTYFKEGKTVLTSNVVVGKDLNKTVIFSANMRYIVFSPYWNIPSSIIKKEIKPGIAENKDYLEQHNMERVNGIIRQKPGPKNSLGLVKFLFPNPYSIYLHDTPSKGLFNREKRAFSHGCIRVAKPIELANEILKDDPNWTPEKIDAAMNKGEENWYTLKSKIPVFIGYFTAWVDAEGVIRFYEDVYQRDEQLVTLLFDE